MSVIDEGAAAVSVERTGHQESLSLSHPRSTKRWSWLSCSMPSAMTSRPRLWASPMMAVTRAELPGRGDQRVDERLVDLEDVDRESLEVAERRVARSEVVHRDTDAELPQLGQGLLGTPRVVHQDAFGDLEYEPMGIDAAQRQCGPDLFGQMGRDELPSREIDRQVSSSSIPCSTRPAAHTLRPAPTARGER
jgi:hypothetical protein